MNTVIPALAPYISAFFNVFLTLIDLMIVLILNSERAKEVKNTNKHSL